MSSGLIPLPARVGIRTPVVDAKNVLPYLRSINLAGEQSSLSEFRELSGGFLNHVTHVKVVSTDGASDYVLKQAVHHVPRDKSMSSDYTSDPERLGKSAQAISWFHTLTTGVKALPNLYNIDAENRIKVIDFFPNSHLTVTDLVAGHFDPNIADKVITALSRMHNATAYNQTIQAHFDNRIQFWTRTRLQCFDITEDEALKGRFKEFYNESEAFRLCLNYGDVDHKNILVDRAGRIKFIDFEEASYTNPAIDLAYLMASNYLAAIHDDADKQTTWRACRDAVQSSWQTYFRQTVFSLTEQARIQADFPHHVLIFMLGRMDGRAKYRFATHHKSASKMRALVNQHFLTKIETLAQLHALIFDYLVR